MKKIEEGSKKEQEAIQPYATARAVEADPWCEVCGGDDHLGNNCPKTKEEVNFIINNNNNGYWPQQQQGYETRTPSTKETKVTVTAIISIILLVTNLL